MSLADDIINERKAKTTPLPVLASPAAPSAGGSIAEQLIAERAPNRAAKVPERKPATTDPLAPEKAILGGAARVAGAGASNVLDVLSRPGNATQSAIARGPGAGLNTLLHSESPEQHQADRDVVKSKLHLKDLIHKLPAGLARGTADAVVDTALDPTTYVGGAGLLEKAVNGIGRAAEVGAVKGAYGLGRTAENVGGRLGGLDGKALARKIVTGGSNGAVGAGDVAGAAYDLVVPGGATRRRLIAQKGVDGISDFNTLYARKNAAQAVRTGLNGTFNRRYDAAIKGLTHNEERELYDAIDKGTIAKLPDELRPNAQQIRDLYRQVEYLEGSKTVKRDMVKEGFTLDPEFAKFNTSTRGLLTRDKRRENYIPHGRPDNGEPIGDIKAESRRTGVDPEDQLLRPLPVDSAARTDRSATEAKDANLKRRENTLQLQDVERQREINKRRFNSAARAIAARDLSRELAKSFAPKREITKTVPLDVDTGEIYRAAVSGLSTEEKRAVGMLQQGASPEQVATRVGFMPSKNLQQRAQTVIDAVAQKMHRSMREQIPTGRYTQRYEDVPKAYRDYFADTYVAPSQQAAQLGAAIGNGPLANALIMTGKGVRGAVNLPKQALFTLPVRHMANISTLAALADPIAAAKATGRAAIAPLVPAAKRSEQRAIAAAERGGVPIQDNPERDSAFVRGIAHPLGRAIGSMTGAGAGGYEGYKQGQSRNDQGGALLRDTLLGAAAGGAAGLAAPEVYRASSNALWHFDDVQKATRYDSLVKSGMKPSDAAARVGADLIDYDDRSSFTKALNNVAPFATYRTKMPGAVVRSIARHPERVLATDRLAPTLAGQEQDAGKDSAGRPLTARSYLPLAETLRATEDPYGYARSSMSYPLQMAATAAGARPPERDGGYANYYTYGKDVAPYALNATVGSIPLGGQQLLDASHLSAFPDQGVGGVLAGQLGLRAARAPLPIDIVLRRFVQANPSASDKDIDRFRRLLSPSR